MSEAAVAEIEPLFRAWLLRHELPDAYARWREAPPERAPMFAFIAVACDGALLSRLGAAAAALVQHADRFAGEVAAKSEMSDEARATAEVVRARIRQWRQRSAGRLPRERNLRPDAPGAPPIPAPQQLSLEEHFRIALKDHPHYRESTARALFRETLRLGAAGLRVVGAPFDGAIMLATARYAARGWRGLIRGEAPSRDECMTAVGLVQQWGVALAANPFVVAFDAVAGTLDDLVVGLCRDVATCLAIAARLPEGAAAPGFAMWEEAEEHLCYAVLSLRPNQLNQMNLDQARTFASAAARLATAALSDPSAAVPVFRDNTAAGGPRMVLATTRFALPNGPDPRRSALGSAS